MTHTTSTAQSRRFLDALHGDAPRGALVELRYRWGVGMRRVFVSAGRLDTVATMIATRAAHNDVYVGIACRRRQGGGRGDLVACASVVWVDCDTAGSVMRARSFSPAPSMVVRSGSGENIHAYWLLAGAAEITRIEQANRCLAHALGADMACTDGARMVRPPSSLNWKHHPPAVVELDCCDRDARYALPSIVGALPDAPDRPAHSRPPTPEHTAPADDPLLAIDCVTYVERLAGVRVPRSGKIACPFHDDHIPSLQVYAETERGWYCYGCGRGGTIYDFAAWTFGLTTRGGDFLELRGRLTELFTGDR